MSEMRIGIFSFKCDSNCFCSDDNSGIFYEWYASRGTLPRNAS